MAIASIYENTGDALREIDKVNATWGASVEATYSALLTLRIAIDAHMKPLADEITADDPEALADIKPLVGPSA